MKLRFAPVRRTAGRARCPGCPARSWRSSPVSPPPPLAPKTVKSATLVMRAGFWSSRALAARVEDVDRTAAEAGGADASSCVICCWPCEADRAAGVEDAAVGGHRQRVDLTHVRVGVDRRLAGRLRRDRRVRRRQARLRVVGVDRRLAAAADHAGGPLDGRAEVLLERRRRTRRRSGPCRCRTSGRPGCHGTTTARAAAAAGACSRCPVKRVHGVVGDRGAVGSVLKRTRATVWTGPVGLFVHG